MQSVSARLRATFSDDVIRVMATATLVSTLGRGAFFTLTALYFTLIVGLSPAQVALILGIASGVGIATSLAAGHLSDHVSARRLVLVLVVGQGAALVAYATVSTFASVLLVACCVNGFQSAAGATRSSLIARAFTGRSRVTTRALLRTVTNIGIALGGAVASVPLLIGTGPAFRIALVLGGLIVAASAIPLGRLPARVDAAPRNDGQDPATNGSKVVKGGRSPFANPGYLALTLLSGLFAVQFALSEVGLPLWIVHDTRAPVILVSVILIVNTILVIALQIPLSSRTDSVLRSGRAVALAGLLMLAACIAYGASGWGGALLASGLLVVAMLFHTLAEILSSAGTWNLSFDLADHDRAGAYQGVFSVGFSLASLFGPLVVTATALSHGFTGWIVLSAVFVFSAAGVALLARVRASRERAGGETTAVG